MSNRTFSVQKSQIHNFLTLSVISGNSEIATMEYQNKNFSSYSIRIESVWLWFPASPRLNLWLIFLKSLKNSSRDLYNSFCGLESFKKCPSQGRVFHIFSWKFFKAVDLLCRNLVHQSNNFRILIHLRLKK